MLTIVILTRRRLHYLRRTVEAMREHLALVEPGLKATWICLDNGSRPEERIQLLGLGFDEVILCRENLGIGPAMNRLVASVRTPLVLYLQDDWVIDNPQRIPFVHEALLLLNADPRVAQVKLDHYHFLAFNDPAVYSGPYTVPGSQVPFFIQDAKMLWGGITFPPSLVRIEALHALGPYREDQPFRRGWAESEYSARSSQRFVVAKSPVLALFRHIGEEPAEGWSSKPTEAVAASGFATGHAEAAPAAKPRIACLLTSWKRPHLLRQQLAAVRAQTIAPDEIALWRNHDPDHPVDPDLLAEIPHVASTNRNWGVWPRFLFCQEFTSEYVCVLDDDTMPGPRWFENCLAAMSQREGLMGTIGIRFQDGTRRYPAKVGWCNPNRDTVPVDLVGHAWFFKRDWLRYYALEPRQGETTCGEDYHFSVALQKHLGLGTYVPPHDPDDRSAWGSTAGERGADAVALYLQPGESEKKDRTHRAYIQAGWRPLALQDHVGLPLEDLVAFERIVALTGTGGRPPVHAPAESPLSTSPTPIPDDSVADLGFTQDFTEDFARIDLRGKPFAFSRFGDGELGICEGRSLRVSDGWTFAGGETPLAEGMRAAVTADLPGYHIGISCPCCDPKGHAWYQEHIRLPRSRVTFANLFVNGNYRRFQRLDLKGTVLVSSRGGHFAVPRDGITNGFDHRPLLDALFKVRQPILVAAGPISCLLIHDYWKHAPQRQTIVDVGSALDPLTHGHTTRGYHDPTHANANKACRWS